MDTATVPIEVPQEEIARFAVGDTVDVNVGGRSAQEGTVSSKASSATEGNSKTSVNYSVEVSIDNSSGRISSQSAATITIAEQDEEEEQND